MRWALPSVETTERRDEDGLSRVETGSPECGSPVAPVAPMAPVALVAPVVAVGSSGCRARYERCMMLMQCGTCPK